ncbi:MAG: hypothetical protein FJY48_11740 [Betaproteobacteria bacterium]|nr:hypothetical protein [Betaproteobacteria bacterium]
MALKLSITLQNGASGDYLRLVNVEWDRNLNSALAYLALYLNKAQADAAPAHPLALVAQINVRAPVFHQHLSNAALAATNHNLLAQIYEIAKTQPGCVRIINSVSVPDLAQAEDV